MAQLHSEDTRVDMKRQQSMNVRCAYCQTLENVQEKSPNLFVCVQCSEMFAAAGRHDESELEVKEEIASNQGRKLSMKSTDEEVDEGVRTFLSRRLRNSLGFQKHSNGKTSTISTTGLKLFSKSEYSSKSEADHEDPHKRRSRNISDADDPNLAGALGLESYMGEASENPHNHPFFQVLRDPRTAKPSRWSYFPLLVTCLK